MKRGNTALKRGVGLASAFALAIAGAVVAAPAASADPGDGATYSAGASKYLDDTIRTQPTADASWLDANGNLRSVSLPYAGYDLYSDTNSSTGQVPTVVPGKTQDAAAIQIKLPLTATGAFKTGDTFTIDFAGADLAAKPAVSITNRPVQLDSLDKVAGYNGNGGKATAAKAAVDQDSSNTSARVKSNVASPFTVAWDATSATVTFTGNDLNSLGTTVANQGTPGYLLTIDGVKVKGVATTGAVTAEIAGVSAGTGATTIAYANALQITAASSYTWANGAIALGDVTLKELSPAALGAGPYTVKVTADPAPAATAPAVAFAGSPYTGSTINGAALTTVPASATDTLTITPGVQVTVATDTVVVKGLTVTGVPFGSDIHLNITPATSSADDSGFAFTPDQTAGAGAVIASSADGPRIGEDSRYATSATLAKLAFPAASVDSVILANGASGLGKDGVDALAANFLAGATSSPILLTDSGDALNQATKDAIAALVDPAADITIYVMGGTDSVSDALAAAAKTVADSLNGANAVTIKRIDGKNRNDTAALAAAAAVDANPNALVQYNFGDGFANTAIVASGTVNADALASGGVSFLAGVPVLLAQDGASALPAETTAALKALNIGNVVILGGVDRVSTAVENSLKADLNVQRVAGTNRFQTSVLVSQFATNASGFGLTMSDTAYLANGYLGWPDALSVGPLAAEGGAISPVLTVSDTDTLPAEVATYLKANADDLDNVLGLGKTDRVSAKAMTQAVNAIA